MEYVPFGGKDKIKLSVAIVQNLICTPTKSGAVCTERDAIKFMMMCQAKALNPFEGDAFLIGYDTQKGPSFSLITAHQAFLKRAELHPEYDGMESGVVVRVDDELRNEEGDFMDEGWELVGGWARVKFKSRSTPMFKKINLSKFKKTFGIWLDNPATMIVKCAEADALRSSFPTMIGGMYLREEIIRDDSPQMATPMFTPKEESINVESKKVEPAPVAPSDKPKEKPIDILEGLLKKNNITAPQFIEALESAALCAGTEKSLNELDDDAISVAIDNFDKFVQIIQQS